MGWHKSFFALLVRVKGAGSEDWSTAAAKASAFASAGDLEQASGIFANASATTPPALKSWADKAKRRVKLEKALTSFASSLVTAGLAKE